MSDHTKGTLLSTKGISFGMCLDCIIMLLYQHVKSYK